MRRAKYYLLATFLLTYVAHLLLLLLLRVTLLDLYTPLNLFLYLLGGFSPTIIALIVVLKFYDERERKTFFKKTLRLKVPLFWWGYVLLLPPAIGLFFQLIVTHDLSNLELAPRDFMMLPLFFLNGIVFGGLEELGWRGVLLDNTKRRFSAVLVTFSIGVFWGLWHLPLYLIGDPVNLADAFFPFLMAAVMYSGFITYVVFQTRSIAMAVFMHAAINASAAIGIHVPFEHNDFVYLGMLFMIMVAFYLLYPIRKAV